MVGTSEEPEIPVEDARRPPTAATNAPTARNVPNGSAYFERFLLRETSTPTPTIEPRTTRGRASPARASSRGTRRSCRASSRRPCPGLPRGARGSRSRRWHTGMPPPAAMPMSEACQPGPATSLQQEADDDARQRDDVRQDLVLEIDDEQHDHRAPEEEPREQEQRSARTRGSRRETSAPVMNSTIGYIGEIGVRHAAASCRAAPGSSRSARSRTTPACGRSSGSPNAAGPASARAAGGRCRRS